MVQYKAQARLEEKRKKALDLHLNFIVDQTEKYSTWLTEGLKKEGTSVGSGSNVVTPAHSDVGDEEFKPSKEDVSDDEETIEKEEAEQDQVKTSFSNLFAITHWPQDLSNLCCMIFSPKIVL